MSRYPLFDRSALCLRPVADRGHQLTADGCLPLRPIDGEFAHPELNVLADAIRCSRSQGRPVILFLGAHPIKLGLSRFVIDLIERRIVTLVATNGAGLIHDFELACLGGTSEDVAKWIAVGQFGLWREVTRINEIAVEASSANEGLGEAIGRTIEVERPPWRDLSIAAAGWRCGVPITCHVGIGHDIIHAHSNCNGAALGQSSYLDFLIFARMVQELEGGVFLNVGSAVSGPEVYLKALSMARNVSQNAGGAPRRFSTAVFDLVPLPGLFREGPPATDVAGYYFRPWKTILVRTVADGGRSFYFCGNHSQTIPTLWRLLCEAESRNDSMK